MIVIVPTMHVVHADRLFVSKLQSSVEMLGDSVVPQLVKSVFHSR